MTIGLRAIGIEHQLYKVDRPCDGPLFISDIRFFMYFMIEFKYQIKGV